MIPIQKEEDSFWSLVLLLVRLDLSGIIQWKVFSIRCFQCAFKDEFGLVHIFIIGFLATGE